MSDSVSIVNTLIIESDFLFNLFNLFNTVISPFNMGASRKRKVLTIPPRKPRRVVDIFETR